jgi:hypothetical protein
VDYKCYDTFSECLASVHRFLDSLAVDKAKVRTGTQIHPADPGTNPWLHHSQSALHQFSNWPKGCETGRQSVWQQ